MSLVPEMESELIQNYSESNEEFCAMEYTREIKTRVQEVNWGPCGKKCRSCDSAIQVQVATPQERVTFRKAVVVVVALEKMKRGGLGSGWFSDTDLLEILTNILVADDVPMHTFEESSMVESVHKFFYSSKRQITDKDHKCLLLNAFPGQAQLVALHLQGENTERRVTLKMASYNPPPTDRKKRPVTLAIEGQSLYLSCLMVDGQPELRLEAVTENMLGAIGSELLRFLFFKGDTSSDQRISTFESATCPGWFISTSPKENEVVTMTSAQNQTAIQTFRLSTP